MNKYFPHEEVREHQDRLLRRTSHALKEGKNIVAHAPTGLGKTAAVLTPALEYAEKEDKTVLFLTGRHTQHEIALETAEKIKEKHDLDFAVTDIVGKKWFCLQDGVEELNSINFSDYCQDIRDENDCSYYNNLRKKEDYSKKTLKALKKVKSASPMGVKKAKKICKTFGVCPYEVSLLLAKSSRLVVTDYLYVFNKGIRDNFLSKIDKELEDTIIVVDEAHNLPGRVKRLNTEKITTFSVKRAISEAEKHDFEEVVGELTELKNILDSLQPEEEERYIDREEFIEKVEDYGSLVGELERKGEIVREEKQSSSIGGVASFLKFWSEEEKKSYTRIISKGYKGSTVLKRRCLDPSNITKKIFSEAPTSVLMSGTLTPTSMYKDLLGVENSEELVLESPFPEKNKLSVITPTVTTKYTDRNPEMFKKMGSEVSKVINSVPGNTAVFFPSYSIQKKVYDNISGCEKTIFLEKKSFTKSEKNSFLKRFKSYKERGAALLGVISGNFGEGIDLPGDYLKAVVVVGLPLAKPNLEVKALIDYYDKKFGKGWDYGYLFPAFNRTLQSAGRCIRSEDDRGVVIFMDKRYLWSKYRRCFPNNWQVKTALNPEEKIERFF